ncbi:CheR family methyltransferase [Alkalicoccus urumqiensis]|uniref:protein-glutamate O-methyltransferase n=1 Tax=Alkalicoccus urumqiensis TaxID=1548213 RepID=A0A2P6MKK1_ALKUR|nr:protein-glutamate O-methyltransferase CheR [Alkalicoccus urumqiensis]PRO66812.1 chemotaxis protein CheR [Alkalicoccus urumqiensis]
MDDYQEFINQVYKKTGINLSLYKEAQMKRRLTSLRDKRGFSSFRDYFHAMQQNQEMFEEFLQRMTINVSEFFRNKGRWDVLDSRILPALKAERGRLSVWSAACSTGEEPYSLSILLRKHMRPDQFSILATDLDQSILDKAGHGFYAEKALKEVTEKEKEQYFIKEEMGLRISGEIKKSIQFKRHNLLADAYPSSMDLILCRNVMIYFTEEAKKEIYHRFAASLKPGGILFVGSTEQIFSPEQYGLIPEDTFFYKKAPVGN